MTVNLEDVLAVGGQRLIDSTLDIAKDVLKGCKARGGLGPPLRERARYTFAKVHHASICHPPRDGWVMRPPLDETLCALQVGADPSQHDPEGCQLLSTHCADPGSLYCNIRAE